MSVATATAASLTLVVSLVVVAPAAARPGALEPAPAVAAAGLTTSRVPVGGTRCTVFPTNNFWNTPVTHLPVHRRNAAWHRAIGSRNLHPDLGSAGRGQFPYGIPVTVVKKNAKTSRVRFDYASESDRRKYPVNGRTRIEGGKSAPGDRHAIIVQKGTCRVFELFDLKRTNGKWRAGSGATWSLTKNKLRPDGWTSADAAGLSILAGLLRYDEVKAGRIDHAIRFTAPVTAKKHIWPARHHAGTRPAKTHPPMGARFRLKKSFSTRGFSQDAKTVIRAMKTYGIVLADNGSSWFFQGEASDAWPSALVADLKRIPSSAFEAVDTSSMRIKKNRAAAHQP